jgi:hypothetical protein
MTMMPAGSICSSSSSFSCTFPFHFVLPFFLLQCLPAFSCVRCGAFWLHSLPCSLVRCLYASCTVPDSVATERSRVEPAIYTPSSSFFYSASCSGTIKDSRRYYVLGSHRQAHRGHESVDRPYVYLEFWMLLWPLVPASCAEKKWPLRPGAQFRRTGSQFLDALLQTAGLRVCRSHVCSRCIVCSCSEMDAARSDPCTFAAGFVRVPVLCLYI